MKKILALVLATVLLVMIPYNASAIYIYDKYAGKESEAYEGSNVPKDATVGEKNALRSGRAYLDAMSFSYEGLIEQLEYEGYTHAEAVFACDILFERNALPLKKGSKGEKVKEVQEYLIELDYLDGSADGVFGSGTESAVKAFQSACGLDVTGVVDEETYDALRNGEVTRDWMELLGELTLDELLELQKIVEEQIAMME